MSEPFHIKAKKKLNIGKVALGLIVLLFVGLIGYGGFKFLQYKQSGGVPQDTDFTQVSIGYPQSGAKFDLFDSLIVDITAISSVAIENVELWVNGELVGNQEGPEGGELPFTANIIWSPDEPGLYSLIASAVDVNGRKVLSSQVVIGVIQEETGIDFVVSTDTEDETESWLPGEVNDEGEMPVNPDKVDDGRVWKGSIFNWFGSLLSDGRPLAPRLGFVYGDCTAQLIIFDLSNNEEGFVVYRQAVGESDWSEIAVLASQSSEEWIGFADEELSGSYAYYVTAFNSNGESSSDPIVATLKPQDCGLTNSVHDIQHRTIIKSRITFPELRANQVYCYHSFDGDTWHRWPEEGFLEPLEGENQYPGPALHLQELSIGDIQIEKKLILALDCWGWNGDKFVQLGKLMSDEFNPLMNDWNAVSFTGDQMKAELSRAGYGLSDDALLYPVTIGSRQIGQLDLEAFQVLVKRPKSLEIPYVIPRITTDPEVCGQHLPADAQNLFGQLIYCFPYPAYDPNLGSEVPQPYLVWDFDLFEPHCVNGIGEDCKSYWDLLELADATGGEVGFDIKLTRNGSVNTWQVTEPNLTMFSIPPIPCLGDNSLSVRMWYRQGKEGTEEYMYQNPETGKYQDMLFFGPYSNPVQLPCGESIDLKQAVQLPDTDPRQYLEVTFNDLYFNAMDDGDMEGNYLEIHEDYELYGYIRVISPSMGQWVTNYGFGGLGADDEPTWIPVRHYLNVGDWLGGDNYLEVTNDGTYHGEGRAYLSSEKLCKSYFKRYCKMNSPTAYKTGNNSLRLYVKDGDSLLLEVHLIDYDELSGDDVACIGNTQLKQRTLEEWSETDDQSWISGVSSTGFCRINYEIKAVGGP